MSSQEIEALKASIDIVDVIDNFTPVTGYGRYRDALCVLHNDTRLGSFKIDTVRQTCRCYVCMDKSMDVIDFLKATGNKFRESLEILKGEKEINGSVVSKASPKAPVAEFVYIKPTHRFTLEDYKHFKHGYPDNVYEYFNEDNEFIGSVLRFNLPDGSKYTPPFNSRIAVKEGYRNQKNGVGKGTYFKIGDIESTFCGFGSYPIYGIEKLNMYPNAAILWVEGQKCATYCNDRCNPEKVIALSCTGGVNNVDKTDLSMIKGRTVYLLSDNDDVGREFMYEIYRRIALDNKVHIVRTWDDNLPKGFDIADNPEWWTAKEIASYIKERI